MTLSFTRSVGTGGFGTGLGRLVSGAVTRVKGAVFALVLAGAMSGAAAQAADPDFSRVVQSVYPAVVDIQAVQGGNGATSPFGSGTDRRSIGSGFIIDKSGYIVTNEHVIRGASQVLVRLHDKTVLTTTTVGTDPATDIAVLKADAGRDLPFVTFGDSNAADIGKWVIAVGNPFGLGGTVTTGIISARDRVLGNSVYDDFIQTDASINMGNSGGPLFNLKGKVIGVNAAMFSPPNVRANVGIGFAIPASIADVVVDQIRKTGKARRGWLGVGINEVTDDIASSVGLRRARGALVTGIRQDSPAGEAGLQERDIILRFNRRLVRSHRDLPRLVGVAPLQQPIPMDVWRNGKSVDLNVVLSEMPQQRLSNVLEERFNYASYRDFGLELESLTPKIARQFGADPDEEGVVVLGVSPVSPVKDRVKAGDVILAVNNQRVTSAEQASEVLKRAENPDAVMIKLKSDGSTRYEVLQKTVEDKLDVQ